MKRRNVELAKMRRPIKRNKITEGLYGSTFIYLRFLFVWILIVLADFSLEFRFEFLWPFYLLIRSVYDSFKYQGLAFSIFFLLIALTSDMLCYFFIPVHWLFFAASTYVWVQYVWHADKCICAPTIVFWILFIYLEAAIRLRDVKHLPGHLDLCRPFAAHCIGYPVVTLGFGFKSYVGYRIRQRKQQYVAKENQFYMQLMQQALPMDSMQDPVEQLLNNATVNVISTSSSSSSSTATANVQNNTSSNNNNNNNSSNNKSHNSSKEKNGHIPNGTICNNNYSHGNKSHKRLMAEKNRDNSDHHNEHKHSDKQSNKNNSSINESHEKQTETIEQTTNKQNKKKEKKEQDKEKELQDYIQKLENENRKFKNDLQQSRANEQELRIQVTSLTTIEKSTKGEIFILQRQIDDYQEKLQQTNAMRQTDKQSIGNLERRIMEERRLKSNLESQLNQERKNRKQEEARLAQVTAQQATRIECTESCKIRKRDLESELLECRRTQRWAEERCKSLELENQAMSEQLRDTDMLIKALSAVQDKNAHLETSLSAETRIKLDLFSALGEAKRQLDISDSTNKAQEKEIERLKSKIAEILAVLPPETFSNNNRPHQGQLMSGGSNSISPNCNNMKSGNGNGGGCGNSGGGVIGGMLTPSPTSSSASSSASSTGLNMPRVRLAESPPIGLSKLDPNATAYTPKNSLITSTEA